MAYGVVFASGIAHKTTFHQEELERMKFDANYWKFLADSTSIALLREGKRKIHHGRYFDQARVFDSCA